MRRSPWITLLLIAIFIALHSQLDHLPNGLFWPAIIGAIGLGGWGLARALPGIWRWITIPLRHNGRLDPLLILLFAVIASLVTYNALHHNPAVNYDDKPHREVMQLWSDLHFPTEAETRGFHYAPLAYWPASLATHFGYRTPNAMKLMQLANIPYALLLAAGVVALCRRLAPHRRWTPHLALFFLAILPCFYRTFAMPRPEGLLATLLIWSSVFAFDLVTNRSLGPRSNESSAAPNPVLPQLRRSRNWPVALGFGLTTGTALLTRQWGAYLLPAFGLVWLLAFAQQGPRSTLRGLLPKTAFAAVLAILVAGWFYWGLKQHNGSMLAFNRKSEGFSLSNQPRSFYFGLGDGNLFTQPAFRVDGKRRMVNQFFPVLLSDTWGDYWAYWQIRPEAFLPDEGNSEDDLDNQASSIPRLGHNNSAALWPTLLLAAGLVSAGGQWPKLFGKRGWRARRFTGRVLIWACPLATLVGYLWFLISYPNLGAGDNLKATYLFQIYPYLAILASLLISGITPTRGWAPLVLASTVAICMIVIAPSLVTAFVSERGTRGLRDFSSALFTTPLLITLGFGAVLTMFFAWRARNKTAKPTPLDDSSTASAH